MPLQLTIPGGPTVDLLEVHYTRSLGQAIQWLFLADVGRESQGATQPGQIANAIAAGPMNVQVAWTTGGVQICPAALVTGAQWSARDGSVAGVGLDRLHTSNLLEITAESTAPSTSPNPFVPRRRVHKVSNMQDLVNKFSGVAQPLDPLKADLRQIKFPDGDKTSIVQDGISDWEFVGRILDQCSFLEPGEAWLPLILSGSVAQATAGCWVMCPASRAGYDAWGEVRGRTVRFQDGKTADGFQRVDFGQTKAGGHSPEFPNGHAPAAAIWRPERNLTGGAWDQWRVLDVPQFTDQGSMIWRIEDRLYRSARDETRLGWDTKVFAVPPQAQFPGPIAPRPLAPWVGTATVQETSTSGPWIRVKLDGFESGEDVADVRIVTPYSGTNGTRGLHFVPENGTTVAIAWPGRFDASVVLVGNTRQAGADFDSPSTYLEATHKVHYEDIHAEKIGNVTIDSALSMAIQQNTSVNSQQEMKLNADGATVNLSGGTVYTGQGF